MNKSIFLMLLTLLSLYNCKNSTTKLTEKNYALAETQVIFLTYKKRIAEITKTNGLGVFLHNRKAYDPNDRTIVKPNFDTLYSFAILDLTEDAIINMPETNGSYQSAWIVTEEHYNPFGIYEPGEYIISQNNTGSKYIAIIIRTQVNMEDPSDIIRVNQLQDKLNLTQNDTGDYNVKKNKDWDMKEILEMREKYIKIMEEKNITARLMFGKKGELTLENHNCGVANGWGGFTEDQAVYIFYKPISTQPASLTLKDVPINAFWSITVYEKDGFPRGNKFHVMSSFEMQNGTFYFGDYANKTELKYLEIYPDWRLILRLYQPTNDYFNSNWTRPELVYNKN